MDQLLREFELLSLPSRVNLEAISDDCVDKLLETLDLERVFEALKARGNTATAFQWRKLREACLISKRKPSQILIEVYEEAVRFNLRKSEMAECHIAVSKLLDFYSETGGFNDSFLSILILFRFYYTGDVNEGLAEVSTILRQKIPLEALKDGNVQLALKVCNLAADENYWMIKKLDSVNDPELSLLIELIGESCKKTFTRNIIRSYPVVPVSWIKTLLHTDGSVDTIRELLESASGDGTRFVRPCWSIAKMVKFQMRNLGDDILGSEKMKITPLGAGSEVGRSCIIVEFKGKTIMLDCGIHPAYAGMSALPFFDEIDPASVDIVLITHFHLDHAAGLPFFMEKTNFKGKVFMTHPTKAIYKWLLSDYVKVSALSAEEQLYDDADLAKSFERITAIDYHQEIEFEGIKFMAFNAGHVLGAAMFLVEVAGVKLLYTGDYSREEDRHLMAAEKPDVSLDVLVCESTYGTQSQQPRLERERRFTGQVHDIVRRGGRCLIPVFALGRAQELLLILDEYWQAHPELHQIPIYYASALAKKCMAVYQTYVNMMNEKIRKQIAFSNPFIFKHISYLRGMESFEDRGPCVMMASPGMLQNGLSRELFERWCPNKLNGVIIAGYCVEGTLAKQILSEPKEVPSINGTVMLPMRMSVEYISFSAHVDFAQNSQFIEECKAPNLILVHGEATEMGRLKGALQHRFDSAVAIFTPRNCEIVELSFRGEKTVKVVGGLAAAGNLKDGQSIEGILLGKDFEYQLLAADEISEYSQLKRTVLMQKQAIASHTTLSLLEFHLVNLFGRAQVQQGGDRNTLIVMKEFSVTKTITKSKQQQQEIILEWEGNVMNDLMADSIISVIMNADYSRSSVKETKSAHAHSHNAQGPSAALYLDVIKQYLIEYFGQVREDEDEAKYKFDLEVPGESEERVVEVSVSMEDFSVDCEEEALRKDVEKVVTHITSLLDVDYII